MTGSTSVGIVGRLTRKREGLRNRDGSVGDQELSGDESRAGPTPESRGELEQSCSGPLGQDAEQIPQIGLGVELVEAAGGDERNQNGGSLSVLVGADEKPIVATDGDAPQLSLGVVVGDFEPPVFEIAAERFFLPEGVADGTTEKTSVFAALCSFSLTPQKKLAEDGARPRFSHPQALGGSELGYIGFFLDGEKGLKKTNASQCRVSLFANGLEELSPGMGHAADFGRPAGLSTIERIVDTRGIGLQVARKPLEQLQRHLMVVLGREVEEDVIVVRDGHEKVSPATLLWLLHQNTRRVGRKNQRVLTGVFPRGGWMICKPVHVWT